MGQQEYMVQRAETRIPTKLTAMLVSKHGRIGVETGLTENVSSRGARVITASEWQCNDTILLAIPGFRFTSAARVAYCDLLRDGQFGTGLQFTEPSEHLEITSLATVIEFPRT
jgi:hypothetical protein